MELKISEPEFNDVLSAISLRYAVYGPRRFLGRGEVSGADYIGYGAIEAFNEIVFDQKSYFSPKEVVFPVRERLFGFEGAEPIEPVIDERPVLMLVRACDINGIHRLDQIFLHNGTAPDYYYARRREKVLFLLIECSESFETCFCVSMESNITDDFAAAFRFGPDGAHCKIIDPTLQRFFASSGIPVSYSPSFVTQNQIQVDVPRVGSLTTAHFDHELWQEYTRRCIACGRCNTSCVSCSCFSMQDSHSVTGTERRRRWAGCQVEGFTDMAGGVSYRKKNGERMRFKAMHKVSDFHSRFGFHQCVGCGRCDMVCPEHISFAHCVNMLHALVGKDNLP